MDNIRDRTQADNQDEELFLCQRLFGQPIVVLVADDDATSRRILTKNLLAAGYEVINVKNGMEAKAILQGPRPPDIALLDWVMPGFSGPELCRLIKNEIPQFVYTVLVTVKDDVHDIIRGMESGAHEFLKKPVNVAEFNARMAAAVRILEYERTLAEKQKEMVRYAEQMEMLAAERAKQLVHAERLATLGLLSAGIGHEIKNPLAYVVGNLHILGKYRPEIERSLRLASQNNTEDQQRIAFLLENGDRLFSSTQEGVQRIAEILDRFSRFAHKGTGTKQPGSLRQCILDAIDISMNSWKYHAEMKTELDELPYIEMDAQQVTQVLVNLLVNAADVTRERTDNEDTVISVTLKRNGNAQRIVVSDNGPGVPEKNLPKIWDPFYTTKKQGDGTGLGLAICKGIIEEHQGRVFAKNLPDSGMCFVIDLKASHS